jgi:hypothetical protein
MSLGFVNPGCELPPIADPQLYFLFSNPNLFHELSERIEGEEFLGDRIYGASLVQVLEQWRYPRECCAMLHFVFTSNVYQKRLFHEWKIPRFFVQSKGNSLSGKCYANALEVNQTFPILLIAKVNLCIFYRPIVQSLQKIHCMNFP